jgi:hypothetical protein
MQHGHVDAPVAPVNDQEDEVPQSWTLISGGKDVSMQIHLLFYNSVSLSRINLCIIMCLFHRICARSACTRKRLGGHCSCARAYEKIVT